MARSMAISVEIKGGNIASAVKQLRKLCLEADMQKEIRKRQVTLYAHAECFS